MFKKKNKGSYCEMYAEVYQLEYKTTLSERICKLIEEFDYKGFLKKAAIVIAIMLYAAALVTALIIICHDPYGETFATFLQGEWREYFTLFVLVVIPMICLRLLIS